MKTVGLRNYELGGHLEAEVPLVHLLGLDEERRRQSDARGRSGERDGRNGGNIAIEVLILVVGIGLGEAADDVGAGGAEQCFASEA